MDEQLETYHLTNGAVSLLLDAPQLRPAFRRSATCEESRHQLYDVEIAEQALLHEWSEDAVVALLREVYQSNQVAPVPYDNYFVVVYREAQLRAKPGDASQTLDFSREVSAQRLSDFWKIDIARVIRHGDENSTWNLVLDDDREILLGTSKQLQDQAHVRAAIFDRTGMMIPRIPQSRIEDWDRLLEMLFAMAITVQSPELSRVGKAKEFLLLYLGQQPGGFQQDFDDEEWEALALRNRPFRRDGAIYIHARAWWNSCIRALAPDITYADAVGLLRLIGATSQRVTLNKVAHTDRAYWQLPTAFIERNAQDESST